MKSIEDIYLPWSDPDGYGDKGTAHSYLPSYEKILSPYREKDINLLEIGLAFGQSLELWYEFFPNGKIYGVDISTYQIFSNRFKQGGYENDERFKIWIEDASSPSFKDSLGDLTFDVVIDDGSHLIQDQVSTFTTLKDLMRPGGVYIIEDIDDIDRYKPVFESLGNSCEILDFRKEKGRWDDVLVVYKF